MNRDRLGTSVRQHGSVGVADPWGDLLFLDQADQITNSLTSLLKAGVAGSILALGVLFFFLRRIDTTVIVGLAIPTSR